MAETEFITVEVVNWDKFNPRKDVKNSSWLRLEHSILEDDDFYDFTHSELVAWIYILAQASKKRGGTVRVSFERAERLARLKRRDVLSAIEKLKSLHIVLVHDTDTSRTRNANDTSTLLYGTGRDGTNGTGRNEGRPPTRAARKLPPLAEIWNQKAHEKLPRVESVSKSGVRGKSMDERWTENPDPVYWERVIAGINGSDFCLGENTRKWKANFDFLIRPDSAAKVLEGKYGGSKADAQAAQVKLSPEAAAAKARLDAEAEAFVEKMLAEEGATEAAASSPPTDPFDESDWNEDAVRAECDRVLGLEGA